MSRVEPSPTFRRFDGFVYAPEQLRGPVNQSYTVRELSMAKAWQ
jgi:hypothetical protein